MVGGPSDELGGCSGSGDAGETGLSEKSWMAAPPLAGAAVFDEARAARRLLLLPGVGKEEDSLRSLRNTLGCRGLPPGAASPELGGCDDGALLWVVWVFVFLLRDEKKGAAAGACVRVDADSCVSRPFFEVPCRVRDRHAASFAEAGFSAPNSAGGGADTFISVPTGLEGAS